MRYQLPLFAVIAVATAIYPAIVYFGLNTYGPRALALLLLAMVLLRALFWRAFSRTEIAVYLVLVGGLCLLVAWFQSEQLLRYYPVLMNFGIGFFFWASLWSERPLIERFAILTKQEFNENAKRYMRRLTLIWAIMLSINALISWFTACCLSFEHWAVYNSVIVYIVFGLFSIGELVVRHYYKKRDE